MRTTRLFAPVLGLAMLTTVGVAMAQYGGPPPPPPHEGYGQGGWDVPPGELREIARQGFRDGIVGAQRDVQNHRRPNVNNRDEYRRPNVPGNVWGDYRMGFRRGYEVGMRHLLGYPSPPPRPY